MNDPLVQQPQPAYSVNSGLSQTPPQVPNAGEQVPSSQVAQQYSASPTIMSTAQSQEQIPQETTSSFIPPAFEQVATATSTHTQATTLDPVPRSNPNGEVVSRRSGRGKVLGVILGVLLLTSVVTGALGYFVAYGHISTGNLGFDKNISHAYMALPFFPKTKSYILEKSALVHADLSSAEVDISVALQGGELKTELEQVLGGAFEMQITGPVDYGNQDNPSFALNFKLTQEFDADLSVVDSMLYFRINKIPAITYGFLGLTPANIGANPLLQRWVSYDLKGLNTEAKQALDGSKEKPASGTHTLTEEKLQQLEKNFLPLMNLSEDTLDGKKQYRFDMDLDSLQIIALSKELAEVFGASEVDFDPKDLEDFRRLEMSIWIEKDTYHMGKLSLVVTANVPDGIQDFSVTPAIEQTSNTAATAQVAVVIKMSQFGQAFDIQAPYGSVTFDRYMLEVSEFFMQQSGFGSGISDDSSWGDDGTDFGLLLEEGSVQGVSTQFPDLDMLDAELEQESQLYEELQLIPNVSSFSPFQQWVITRYGE